MREAATANVLMHYIHIPTALGGMCIGMLSILTDLVGAIGSGTGILLAITIICDEYMYIQEYKQEHYSPDQLDTHTHALLHVKSHKPPLDLMAHFKRCLATKHTPATFSHI